jgi:hypothetical protein
MTEKKGRRTNEFERANGDYAGEKPDLPIQVVQ